jgi:hypothetical protein
VPFPFASHTTGQMAPTYQITALGTVLVYDKTGEIVAKMVDPGLQDLRAGLRRAGV